MKPNALRCLSVTAAAAAAALCWYLLSMKPDSTPRTARKGLVPAAHVSGKQSASKPAETFPKFGTTEFKRTLLDRGQKWLDARGRDAEGLVAMWDLTGDKALLHEAAEKFPNDPRVCMAMAQWHKDHTEKAMPWIERLIAAEPANPEGHYQKAWALVDEGWALIGGSMRFGVGKDRAGALAALRQAAAMSGRRNDHLAERIRAAREAALALGVVPGDAVRLALDRPMQHNTTSRALVVAKDAIMGEVADAKAAGSEERLMEITGIGLLTADKFTDGGTVLDELSANSLQLNLLADLPDDTEIGAGGRSVRSWRSDVENRRSYLMESHQRTEEANALLETANDREMVSYFHCRITHGEQARCLIEKDTEST